MSYVDLHAALRDWPYEPEKISVRKILGSDDTVRIQMRVELGIIQMDADGRPDGFRPHGAESLLAYHLDRLGKYQSKHDSTAGYELSREECEALRLEASLFYRRYIALFVLEEFEGVLRDTAHSLAIFDLCREFAKDQQDRDVLEEFRAYVLMMHARALAYHSLQQEEPASALAHVNRGILDIRAHLEESGRGELVEKSEEIKILRALAKEVERKLPTNSVVRTRRALRAAIEQERFEEAAQLRDRLKRLYQKAG
jgi:hypothetical protein